MGFLCSKCGSHIELLSVEPAECCDLPSCGYATGAGVIRGPRRLTAAWTEDYNGVSLHASLGQLDILQIRPADRWVCPSIRLVWLTPWMNHGWGRLNAQMPQQLLV